MKEHFDELKNTKTETTTTPQQDDNIKHDTSIKQTTTIILQDDKINTTTVPILCETVVDLNDTLLTIDDFSEPNCMIHDTSVLTDIVSNMFPTKQCETHEVLWDTGATLSVSAHKEDFIGTITPIQLRSK
jgi:hypothetical protein